jgi:D-aminoacyl-tRNA deacylase
MRVVIQRVTSATVVVNNIVEGTINSGLLVLVGIENTDTDEDINWLSNKIVNLRIFNDESDIMNKSVLDIKADILLISQFTLYASTKKGNRPSYIKAAVPNIAMPIYIKMIKQLEYDLQKPISTGVFGADMKVSLVNDGPVTITIDSKNRE